MGKRKARSTRTPRSRLLQRPATYLSIQATLTLLPVLWLDNGWHATAVLLVGALLMILPGRHRWVLFLLVAALLAVVVTVLAGDPPARSHLVVQTGLAALAVYGLRRLSNRLRELDGMREEVARVAAARERQRLGRDLHDLLGYSLTAIVLKGELVRHLLASDPQRARAEVTGILQVAHEVLNDIRRLPEGCRQMSLAAEIETVRSLCTAAGITVTVRNECHRLPSPVDTVMATVIREGVTNILRHSDAGRIGVTVTPIGSWVRLTVTNDGVRKRPCPPVTAGSGLRNLALRLNHIEGWLSAGPADGDRYVLVASAPRTGGQHVAGSNPVGAAPAV